MKPKWSGIPIPEACVGGLVAGGIAQLLFPAHSVPAAWIGHVVGWPLILLDAAPALWAVAEASQVDISAWISAAKRQPWRFGERYRAYRGRVPRCF